MSFSLYVCQVCDELSDDDDHDDDHDDDVLALHCVCAVKLLLLLLLRVINLTAKKLTVSDTCYD